MVYQCKTNRRDDEESSDLIPFDIPATFDRVEFGHDDHLDTEEELEEEQFHCTVDVVEWEDTENYVFPCFYFGVCWADDVDYGNNVRMCCLFRMHTSRIIITKAHDVSWNVPQHPLVYQSCLTSSTNMLSPLLTCPGTFPLRSGFLSQSSQKWSNIPQGLVSSPP